MNRPKFQNLRSATMASIRSTGNRSTERRLRMGLVQAGISGWVLHSPDVFGRPDFWFARRGVAVFVDGCFWHRCKFCSIPMPQTNTRYWEPKLAQNVARARAVTHALRESGITVVRIWEHELRSGQGLSATIKSLQKLLCKTKPGTKPGGDKTGDSLNCVIFPWAPRSRQVASPQFYVARHPLEPQNKTGSHRLFGCCRHLSASSRVLCREGLAGARRPEPGAMLTGR
jgi:DNA mismatch endonuclease (patch repair protein)